VTVAESRRADVIRAWFELAEELGRTPANREVAERAGVDVTTVRRHNRVPFPPARRDRFEGDEDLVPGVLIVGLPEEPPEDGSLVQCLRHPGGPARGPARDDLHRFSGPAWLGGCCQPACGVTCLQTRTRMSC